MKRTLTLRRRLAIGFGALLVVVAALGLVVRGELERVESSRGVVAERSVPFAAQLATAQREAKAIANDERGFLLTRDPEFRAQIGERAATVVEALGAARQAAPTPHSAEQVKRITAGFEAWTAAVEEELDLAERDPAAASALALGANRDKRKAYEELFKALDEEADAEVTATLGSLGASVSAAKRTLVLAFVLLALLSVGLGAWVARDVRRRVTPILDDLASLRDDTVAALDDGLAAVARGDLTHPVSAQAPAVVDDRPDEIGRIATAVGDIRERTSASVASYNAMRAELAAMIGDLGGSAGTVSSASHQMASTSEETGRAVSEIAGAVGEVADGAERQVQLIGVTLDNVAKSAAAAIASADSAQQTAERAGQARLAAHEGVSAAEQATRAMREVAESSAQVSGAIQGLAGKSDQIGGIVHTITAIAGQTNLLALNAAIEAARAGEQGRGFAVVAEEVRKLAEESQAAAAQIAGLIEQIQGETNHAVGVVQEGVQRTQDGVETVAQTREAFVRIGEYIDDVSGRIGEIAESAGRMAADAERIQEDIGGVATVAEQSSASAEEVSASTQQTSASTQEIAATAQELAGTADELARTVARFKLAA